MTFANGAMQAFTDVKEGPSVKERPTHLSSSLRVMLAGGVPDLVGTVLIDFHQEPVCCRKIPAISVKKIVIPWWLSPFNATLNAAHAMKPS
eukprot:CAMPEP_0172818094 /NCGR_PEP_ID=MMETSP1075-20121228/13696_1 /TAXON_ID=2916 /ORGANISM="Ceratium fusus, Strain PA161109" /LENGTH=90 /DNA_ID=CAMNT_0013658415 /DNA_START=166 /DNA_END=436 /DNA_ORIENTATION=-